MGQRIKIRRDTSFNWTANNPVLQDGELSYETDTKKLKVGNGVTAWNALPYFSQSLNMFEGVGSITAPNAIHQFTHGIINPKFAEVYLKCKVANNGYAVGDYTKAIANLTCSFNSTTCEFQLVGSTTITSPTHYPKAGGPTISTGVATNWDVAVRVFG